MLEGIILGIIQGVAEWLPVSSEGLLFLAKANFFSSDETFTELIQFSLFLHLGTFFAALIYLRKDVARLLAGLFKYREASEETRVSLKFLIVTTAISGAFGYVILKIIEQATVSSFRDQSLSLDLVGPAVNLFVGLLLIITAILQLKARGGGKRKATDIKTSDSLVLGLVQALAAFPGLSRSGLTVSALLLKKFNEQTALRLSFLMSLPIVLAGNIILNLEGFTLTASALWGFAMAFIFGLLTIHALLALARKINFGWFVLIFAILTIGAAFI